MNGYNQGKPHLNGRFLHPFRFSVEGHEQRRVHFLESIRHQEAAGDATNLNRISGMNLRELSGFDVLTNAIVERAHRKPVAYFPNPGNWGDGLIHAGTVQFLGANKIDYRSYGRAELDVVDSETYPLAIVGGGGGWCRNWHSTPAFLEKVAERFENVVLLPTSFDQGIAARDLPNVLYFSRDLNGATESVLHCPDMAFYYDFPTIDPSLGYPLLAFRRDKERSDDAIAPFRNWDLPLLGNANQEVKTLIGLVAKFKVVYTDRLHIGIIASMLGRNTHLLDGNYRKNVGVFESTLGPNLNNSQLITWDELKTKNPMGLNDPNSVAQK